MRSPLRLFSSFILAAAMAYACVDGPHSGPYAPLTPLDRTPEYARIQATDSLMRVTDVVYSDTAVALKRIEPLAADLSDTITIGKNGGSLRLDKAGVRVDFPGGALPQPTLITVTARAGAVVAYEFLPHGITFSQPVRITQDLKVTQALQNPLLLKNAHGGYYDTTLDSAWIDTSNNLLRVKEHQLGYFDVNGSSLRFSVGHFSGYIVICGRDEQ